MEPRAHRGAEVFRNENPFEVSKFNFFKSQLPPTSNLSGLIGSTSLGCAECDTCAVVGASGSLLNRRHGPLIDAHQVVLRPNWLLIKGYEHLVGTRTDLNLFFGVEGMIDQFDVTQGKLPPHKRAIGLVTPASDRSVASFFGTCRASTRTAHDRAAAAAQPSPSSRTTSTTARSACCCDRVCTWAKSTSRTAVYRLLLGHPRAANVPEDLALWASDRPALRRSFHPSRRARAVVHGEDPAKVRRVGPLV